MRWQLSLWVIVISVLLVPAVLGDFSIGMEGEVVDIFPNESAVYTLEIENLADNPDRYIISTLDPKWLLDVDPSPGFIDAGANVTYRLLMRPSRGLEFGYHGPLVLVRSQTTGETVRKNLLIYLKPQGLVIGRYPPSVALDVELPHEVDPRIGWVQVDVGLRNRNALDIEEALVVVKSDLFRQEQVLPIGPLEEKQRQFRFQIDPQLAPGLQRVSVSVHAFNSTIAERSRSFNVLAYEDLRSEEREDSSLFRTITTLSVVNNGNQPSIATLHDEASWLHRIFSSASNEPQIVENVSGTYWSWEIPLEPNERADIHVVTNYRWLVLIITLIIVGIVCYYLFRSPIVVIKEAVARSSPEHGVSDMKVMLLIRNRSGKVLRSLNVVDTIPSIAQYVSTTSQLGTLQPSRVSRSESRGTILKWELDSLDPYEERVITYRLRSKLHIMGGITLNGAKVRFETGVGRERVSFSNNARLRVG